MALEKQMVSLAFEKGLNQKVSDRVLNAPELADVQNGRFEKAGEIRRRHGFTPLMINADVSNTMDDEHLTSMSGLTSLECNKGSAVYKNEKLIFDGLRVHAQRGNNAFVRKGVVDATICESKPLSNNQSVLQSAADIAYISNTTYGNFYCAVYYESDATLQNITGASDRKSVKYTAYAQLYDADTEQAVGDRQRVTQYTLVDTTHAHSNEDQRLYLHPHIQVRAVGDYFIVVFTNVVFVDSNPDTVRIQYRTIQISGTKSLSATLPSGASLVTNNDYCIWDLEKVTKVSGETERLALFYHSDASSVGWGLEEFKFNTSSGALDATGMRSLTWATSSYDRAEEAYDQYNNFNYSCMVRHFKVGSDDSNDKYMLLFPSIDGSTRKTRYNLVDSSGGSLAVGSAVGLTGVDEAMLNGCAVLEPVASGSETHLRLYFTTSTSQGSSSYPNVTTTKSARIQLSNGSWSLTSKAIALNTTIVSHPWTFSSTTTKPSIYLVIAESVNGFGGTDYSAGATYVVRDDLDDRGDMARERLTPIASTQAGDVAHTHFSNWFLGRYTVTGGAIFTRSSNFLHNPVRPVVGPKGNERVIGCSSYIGANLQSGFPCFNASILRVDHTPKRMFPSTFHNNHLLIGGGFLKAYDGYRAMEVGFLRRPQIKSVTPGVGTESVTGVSGRMEPGVYTYRAVYEYIDKAGNLHRSAPSDPVDTTTTETGSGTTNDGHAKIVTYTYQHSLRMYEKDQVRLVIYRSLKGQVVSFRVADKVNFFDGLTSELIDLNADSDIYDKDNPSNTHEILYTNAEAPSENLGSITDIAVHQNRVFLSTANSRVHICKQTARGLAPEPYARGSFQFREVEGGSEAVRGLESNGDHLLIFTSENVFAIAGQGPLPDGSGSTLTEPRLLIAGQGAVDGSIHAVIPSGCIYQSSRGLYIIGRDTRVNYIGANVEDLTAYRAIAAVANDARHELYIALGEPLAGGADYTGYSKVLVFNYFFNAWTQYTHTASVMGYNNGLHVVGGVLHQARATYGQYWDGSTERQSSAGSDVGFWKEDTASYWDQSEGASPTYDKFSTIVETPAIYLNELQGAQRVYRVMFQGEYLGDHDITVEMTVDHDAASAHSQTQTASGLTTKDRYRLPVKRQKCRAMKIKHTIAPNSSSIQTNGLFKLSGLALEVGLRPTSFKLPKGDTI